MGRRAIAALAASLGLAAVTFALFDQGEARGSVQQCDTECQSRMTDCILACDGVLSCELGCKAAAVRCVDACRDASTAAPRDLDAGGYVRRLPEAGIDAHAESGIVRDARRLDGGRAILARDR